MSAIKEFNNLGGKIVSRENLISLMTKAFNEQSFEVHKRITTILDKHPKAQEFEFEPNAIKKIEENSKLGIPVKLEVRSKKMGENLVFFYGEKMLATIRPNGLIEYETSKLPRGARNIIRKASNNLGLNAPVDENMLHGLELLPDNEDYGLGKPVSQNEIYDNITKLMINTIKEVGHLPWQKEWNGSGIIGAKNFVTGKPYTGVNFFTLNFVTKYDADGKPYLVAATDEPQYFLTFNQIETLGGKIKKGARARMVVYYNFILNYKDEKVSFSGTDADKFADFAKKNNLSETDVKKGLKRFPILKYYNVFNSNDVDGLPAPPKQVEKNINPNDYAQFIIDNYPNKPDYRFGSPKAFYVPSGDYVSMPFIKAFKKESSYYSTFFHEIVHSTGHKSRLNRDMSGSFGNDKYAFEELIAELGATYLCAETGILFETIDNSAKYLKGWSEKLISKMEEDNKFFMRAAAQAQKATNYILDTENPKRKKYTGKKPKAVTEKPKTVTKNPKSVTKKAENVTKKPKNVTKNTQTPKKPTNEVDLNIQLKLKEFPYVVVVTKEGKKVCVDMFVKKSVATKMANRIDEKFNPKVLKNTSKWIENFNQNKQSAKEKMKIQFSEAGKKAGEKKNIVKVTNPRTKKTAVIDKEKGKILRYENPKTFDKKPKSVSVSTAIKDVLTLPKYKGNKLLVATILYNKFKDFKNDDFFEIKLTSDYEKGVLKNDSELHSYFYYTEELSLTEKGYEFVKAVNARLESLRNQKHNYSMFDNLANPENIEVIEPNPVIPFVAQIPEEKEQVLDQIQTTQTNAPVQKKSRLMSMVFETLPMKGKFANLMQHPAKNLKIGIFGKPKNGKTAGSLQLAEYLTQFGNVLYNFADQGFNLSTQMLWKASGLANYPENVAKPCDATTLDELEKELATGLYSFCFIDLINDYIDREKVTPQEFKDRFIRKYDDIGFILVFESTKNGDFKGDQKWMHVVDAIANVEDFIMTMRGRYGNGDYLIWEQGLKDVNPKRYQEWLDNNTETIEPEESIFSDEIEII